METTDLSSIPQLIEILKHSFRESEFDEVQEFLMDRENKLERDLASTKKDVQLLENSLRLAELDKLTTEEKLQRSLSKCEELDHKLTRLTEEHKVSCQAEDRHEKVSKEFLNTIREKDKLILELKNTIVEKEQLVMELRRKQSEGDAQLNFEAIRALDQLRHEEKMGVKKRMGNLLNANANGKKVDLPDNIMIKGWRKDRLQNTDAQNVAIPSSNSSASDDTPLVIKGCRNVVHPISQKKGNVVHPLTKEDGRITGPTSGSQAVHNSSRVEINGTAQDNKEENPVFSGSHASQHPSKTWAASNVVETSDRDDEAKPDISASFGKKTRKRRLVKLYPSSESD